MALAFDAHSLWVIRLAVKRRRCGWRWEQHRRIGHVCCEKPSQKEKQWANRYGCRSTIYFAVEVITRFVNWIEIALMKSTLTKLMLAINIALLRSFCSRFMWISCRINLHIDVIQRKHELNAFLLLQFPRCPSHKANAQKRQSCKLMTLEGYCYICCWFHIIDIDIQRCWLMGESLLKLSCLRKSDDTINVTVTLW